MFRINSIHECARSYCKLHTLIYIYLHMPLLRQRRPKAFLLVISHLQSRMTSEHGKTIRWHDLFYFCRRNVTEQDSARHGRSNFSSRSLIWVAQWPPATAGDSRVAKRTTNSRIRKLNIAIVHKSRRFGVPMTSPPWCFDLE